MRDQRWAMMPPTMVPPRPATDGDGSHDVGGGGSCERPSDALEEGGHPPGDAAEGEGDGGVAKDGGEVGWVFERERTVPSSSLRLFIPDLLPRAGSFMKMAMRMARMHAGTAETIKDMRQP